MKLKLRHRESLKGYIFISPWIVGTALFVLGPLAYSFHLSFRTLSLEDNLFHFVGLRNYVEAFILDAKFLPLLLNTFARSLVEIPLVLVFSLTTALLVSRKGVPASGLFKVILFLPVVISSGMVVQELMSQGAGDLSVVRSVTVESSIAIERYLGPAIAEQVAAVFNRLTFILWRTGVQILIFIAALQGIPASMYEAARVDGANEWETLWLVTLPMVTPIILLNAVYTVVDSFTDVFNEVLTYIHSVAFREFRMGYAAALGWMYFLLIFVLIGIVFLVMRRWVYYAGER